MNYPSSTNVPFVVGLLSLSYPFPGCINSDLMHLHRVGLFPYVALMNESKLALTFLVSSVSFPQRPVCLTCHWSHVERTKLLSAFPLFCFSKPFNLVSVVMSLPDWQAFFHMYFSVFLSISGSSVLKEDFNSINVFVCFFIYSM